MDILKQFVLIATLGLLPLKTEAQCGGPFKAFKEWAVGPLTKI